MRTPVYRQVPLLMAIMAAALIAPVSASAQMRADSTGAPGQARSKPMGPDYHIHDSVVLNPVSEQTPPSTAPISQHDVADAVLGAALRDLNERSDEHFHKGEFNHIIALNRIIVQGDPHDLEAYANSAYLLWSTDRFDEGIAFLKTGAAVNNDNYYMPDELGSAYWLYAKDPARAIPYYEKAVTFPCPLATWHSLANCYYRTKQLKKCLEAWRTVAHQHPDDLIGAKWAQRVAKEMQAKGIQ